MSERLNINSGAPWEEKVGYSRAVRIGNTVEVSGTVAVKDGKVVGIGDAYTQTKTAIEIVENALMEAGVSLENVVRTRMFVTDIRHWDDIGRAHGEAFRNIKPATTMVEVVSLIHPDYLMEIEATAVI